MKSYKIIIFVTVLLASLSMSVLLQTNNHDSEAEFIVPKAISKTPSAAFERQQFFLQKRLPVGVDQLPFDPYRTAINQLKNQDVYSTRKGYKITHSEKSKLDKTASEWEWLGPGNVGGRTRAMVFHPDNHEVMFAGGVSGGIWKTTNGGQSWQALADNMANINIGALAIDENNPDTLYAGTGELYRLTLRPYSSMSGAGVFKTTDGGKTWFQLNATVNEQFMYVSDIVISPNNSNRIYAATNAGVWRSDDGGISFVQTLNPVTEQGEKLYEGCNDLSIRNDQSDDWLLVSCASRSTDDRYYLPGLLPEACNGPCDARIYLNKQAQSGDDWQVTLTEPGMGRTEMAIHRDDPNIIYASSSNTDGGPDLDGDGAADLHNGLHAIFRSNDGGQTWQATLRNTNPDILNTQLFSYADGALASYCGDSNWYYSAGWYNQAIAVSPTDPNVVWVGGMEIYRSDDGGKNFGMASDWDALFYNDTSYHDSYVHADQHALLFHPEYDGVNNKTLYALNDGGIYLTEDDSKPVKSGNDAPCLPATDGIQWQSINHNYGTTQFYAGDVFSDAASYLAGAQDNGTQLGSDTSGVNGWVWINGGDGADLAINPSDDRNFYVSSQNANIQRTENGGSTFTSLISLAQNSPTATPWHNTGIWPNRLFITPYEIDPNQNNRLFLGGDRLWRSDNRGTTWKHASPSAGSTFDDLISALAVAPGNSNHVIYGNNKIIAVVSNALTDDNLFNVSFTRPRQGWVSSLAFDPNDSQVAYATYSTFGGQHVWKSINGGNRWTAIDGSGDGQLPDVPVHKIVVDPNDGDRLYIGTDLGVFVTVDGGENWWPENTGFSQVITEDLVIRTPAQGGDPQLFAFTYGRGVWRVPLAQLDAQPDFVIDSTVTGNWFNSEQSGHGLQIEVIEQNGTPVVLAAWYVYHQGEPIWIIGLGTIEQNRAVLNMSITSNTGFPVEEFFAEDVENTPWGTVELVFESDATAQMIWSSVLTEFNNGSMSIQRLTQTAENVANFSGIRACHSGSWFNPQQSGHGFMLQVLQAGNEQNLLMTWYTYVNGRQYWLIGTGPVEGNQATVIVHSASGADFPPSFDANEVEFEEWGTLTFTLLDDANAVVSWQTELSEFSNGQIDVSRLTQIAGYACSP